MEFFILYYLYYKVIKNLIIFLSKILKYYLPSFMNLFTKSVFKEG